MVDVSIPLTVGHYNFMSGSKPICWIGKGRAVNREIGLLFCFWCLFYI